MEEHFTLAAFQPRCCLKLRAGFRYPPLALVDVALCANMTETSLVTAISEQGGKENQYGNDERFCPARCGCDGSI
jgi:hypothetical protein